MITLAQQHGIRDEMHADYSTITTWGAMILIQKGNQVVSLVASGGGGGDLRGGDLERYIAFFFFFFFKFIYLLIAAQYLVYQLHANYQVQRCVSHSIGNADVSRCADELPVGEHSVEALGVIIVVQLQWRSR